VSQHPIPSATVELRGLVISGFCGVLPEEQDRKQPLEFDLDIDVEVERALASDELEEAVDYGSLCAAIEHLLETDHFGLLEGLAARVAELVMADGRVLAVTVAARKLEPPVPQQLRTAGVRYRRTRPPEESV
jgi:dihydroneopterin aldolase